MVSPLRTGAGHATRLDWPRRRRRERATGTRGEPDRSSSRVGTIANRPSVFVSPSPTWRRRCRAESGTITVRSRRCREARRTSVQVRRRAWRFRPDAVGVVAEGVVEHGESADRPFDQVGSLWMRGGVIDRLRSTEAIRLGHPGTATVRTPLPADPPKRACRSMIAAEARKTCSSGHRVVRRVLPPREAIDTALRRHEPTERRHLRGSSVIVRPTDHAHRRHQRLRTTGGPILPIRITSAPVAASGTAHASVESRPGFVQALGLLAQAPHREPGAASERIDANVAVHGFDVDPRCSARQLRQIGDAVHRARAACASRPRRFARSAASSALTITRSKNASTGVFSAASACSEPV